MFSIILFFSLFCTLLNGSDSLLLSGEPTVYSCFVDTTYSLPAEFLEKMRMWGNQFNKIGFEIGGCIVENSPQSTVELATDFGNTQGIGSKKKNNGITIAIVLEKRNTKGEKPAIGVAVGRGLEGYLNDAKIGRFLDETFVKERKNGDWQKGVLSFLEKLHQFLSNTSTNTAPVKRTPLRSDNRFRVLFICIIFIVFILNSIRKVKNDDDDNDSHNGPRRPKPPLSFGGPWTGGYGGGGRGGGGSFGGGGAGRCVYPFLKNTLYF